MSVSTDITFLPDEFFQNLDIDQDQKDFIIQERHTLRNRLEMLSSQCQEPFATNAPLAVAKKPKKKRSRKPGKPVVEDEVVNDVEDGGSGSETNGSSEKKKRSNKVANPRAPAPSRIRCLSYVGSGSGKNEHVEQCKFYNKMDRKTTLEQSLAMLDGMDSPSDIFFCTKHIEKHTLVENPRNALSGKM
jgi:hypothetical protein